MKTQEEYAREINEIVLHDVESHQSDWFEIDREIFMQSENKDRGDTVYAREWEMVI